MNPGHLGGPEYRPRPLRPDDPRGPQTQGDQPLVHLLPEAPGCPAIWGAHLSDQCPPPASSLDVPTDPPTPQTGDRVSLLPPHVNQPISPGCYLSTRVQAPALPLRILLTCLLLPATRDLCSGQPEPSSRSEAAHAGPRGAEVVQECRDPGPVGMAGNQRPPTHLWPIVPHRNAGPVGLGS